MPSPKALIIGASGQVGAALVRELGTEQVVQTFHERPVAGGLQFGLKGVSPTDARALLGGQPFSAVYLCAAWANVDACEDDPATAMAVNCDAAATLAQAAAELRIPFVYYSTDYVFDGKAGPYGEDDAVHPLSAYGRSKLAGEIAVRSAYPAALILRTSLVFGDDPGHRNFPYSVRRKLGARESIQAARDQYSTPTYNRDLASASVQLVRAGASGTFHVNGPERLNRVAYAQRVAEAFELDASLIQPVSTAELWQRALRPLESGLKIDKLLHTLPALRMRSVAEALMDWRRHG